MDAFDIDLSATRIVILLSGSFLLYFVLNKVFIALQNRNYAHSQGCQHLPVYPTTMFGLSALLDILKASKEYRLLEANRTRFDKVHGRTFTMMMGGKSLIYTIDPENIKTMLATQFQSWSLPALRKSAFCPLLGNGIFTNDGHAWKRSREMLKPNFTRDEIGNVDILEHHTQNLIHAIRAEQIQSSVDLGGLFFRLTTDFATQYLFGEATESLTKGAEDGFAEAFDGSLRYIGLISKIGNIGALFGWKKFQHDRKFMYAFVDRCVSQALDQAQQQEKQPERYTFLHELVRQTNDRVTIRSELLNILLAGRDTTASLLTNTWRELSHRPDIVQRLREEIASNLDASDQLPSFEDLKNLPYLSAVFKEALRLYPVVPLNSREATVATTLPRGGGTDGSQPIFISKGQSVIWNLYAMQRNVESYGSDAEAFNPDRWLDTVDGKGLRPGWAYLPFNAGPRICLGQQLALTEVSYVTVRLLQEFGHLEARDERPWTEKIGVTCVNKFGAKVALS